MKPNPPLHELAAMACRWFDTLPEEDRALLMRHARRRHLAAGERVFSRGDPPNGFFGVESGVIKSSGISPDGQESVLDFFGKGAWFGEVAALGPLRRLHSTVAYTPSTLLQVDQRDIEALLDGSHSLCRAFLRLETLRLGLLLTAIEQYSVQSLEARLASRLLMLADAFGADAADGTHIELRLPHEMLAALIGASRQRISQILKEWEGAGLIRHRYGRVLVCDRQRLDVLAAY